MTVTLSQVAAEAGVSESTASRALSNSSHRVNERTQQHILAVAQRLGYKVNPIARALRRSITGTIGMVVPSLENPFFTELVRAVEQVLAAQNLNLFLGDSRNDLTIEAQRLRGFTNGSVDGVLISPCHSTGSFRAVDLTSQAVPLIQLDRRVDGIDRPWVGIDDAAAMHDVFSHLAETGVRSAALITSTASNSSASDRMGSARSAAAQNNVELRVRHVLDGEFSVAWGATAVDLLLDMPGRAPHAVVCTDDILALGAMSQLRSRGYSVPDDFVVTGFDDIIFSSLVDPKLTTIKQPLDEMATTAVAMLTPAANPHPKRTMFAGQLIIRDSTGRP